nr:uncharacterized protein LOC116280277 [Vicugna pacos]
MPIESSEELAYSCNETIEHVYSSRPDLRDQPLEDPDAVWFTDGSSYIHDGIRKAGYAVVDLHKIIEADALPPQTSAQKAELTALAGALRLGKDKRINIYTDSKYAFLVLHAHAAIWKHRGLLTAWGSPVQHCQEILELLDAIQDPKEVAVIHRKGHQKANSDIARGNNLADRTARKAALKASSTQAALLPHIPTPSPLSPPRYTDKEIKWAKNRGYQKGPGGWWIKEQTTMLPRALQWRILKSLHDSSYLEKDALTSLVEKVFSGMGLPQTISEITKACNICYYNNPGGKLQPLPFSSLSKGEKLIQERTGK